MPRLDRGIRYAAASRFNYSRLGVLDYWIVRSSRAMTASMARPFFVQWLQASAVTIADDKFNSVNMILPATTNRTLASVRRNTVSGTRVAL